MGVKSENTNMASEFYVMSILYRIGVEPVLTLGNKKDIDIVLQRHSETYTIDVKGLKGKTSWFIGNKEKIKSFAKMKNHYFVFVSYLNKFHDTDSQPEIYIVPAVEVVRLKVNWGSHDQNSIEYRDLKKSKFLNAWHYFK